MPDANGAAEPTQTASDVRKPRAPVVPWPVFGTVDAHIRAERVRMLFHQAPPVQLLSVAAAGVLVWVLWDVSSRVQLGVWLAAITLLTFGRAGLTVGFRRRAPTDDEMPAWEVAFVGSLAALCLVWGVGGWLVMPFDSLVHQAIVYFFLMGIAGGAVASYGAHVGASAVAVTALIAPATIAFGVQPAIELRAMAVGGLLYLAAAIRSTRGYDFFLRRSFQLSHELHDAYARARELARTDDLTGLPNRRAFVEQGATMVEVGRRHNRPVTLILFDIDHFKQINDTHGHAAGDAVLKTVAEAMWHVARTSDGLGRLGGEEFGLLLPETPAENAMIVAERLRHELSVRPVAWRETTIAFTCSFGVAARTGERKDLDALLSAADAALYRAKAEGRDRVERAEPVS